MQQFEQGPEDFKSTDNSGQTSDALARDLTSADYESTFNNGDKDEDIYTADGQSIDFGKTDLYAQTSSENFNQGSTAQSAEGSTQLNRDVQDNADTAADTAQSEPVTAVDKFDFADSAKELFPRLDTDGNENLSNDELKEAMLDPSFKGQDAQTVAALFEASKDGTLKNMVRGDGFGISEHDLTEMDVQAEHGMTAFRSKMGAQKLVKGHGGEDGKLSREEIDQALTDGNLSERDRINLEFLQENFDLIDDGNDGLSTKDIKAYGDKAFDSKGMKQALKAESTINAVHREQVSDNPRELYANSDNPLESIQDPEAVVQQGPSCFFEASLLSVAQADPESVKNMIEANEDGSYTVTFPGDTDNPITVEAPTEAEMGEYHASAEAGQWGNIMQKAHGKYMQESYFRRHFHDLDGGDIPAEGNFGGEARLGETMKLLTGRDYDRDGFAITPLLNQQSLDLASSEQEMQTKLTKAFSGDDRAPVIASTAKPAHVYAITGFDGSGPDGGTVEFIDPLGGGKDQISVKEALKKFNAIAYGKGKDT